MIKEFEKYNNIHFIGIGGIGMSAIARMMLLDGKKVSGSDSQETDLIKHLRDEGSQVSIGHEESNVSKDVDLVVYTIAVTSENPELKKAQTLNIETKSYPEMLALVSSSKKTIAIAGTHGKTTTTSFIGSSLVEAGNNPSLVVGSILKKQQTNVLVGESDLFVVEACEYKRSFLNLHPHILVITNIESDHLDYYKDFEDIKNAFEELVFQVDDNGFVVANLQNEVIKEIQSKSNKNFVDYSDVNVIGVERKNLPGEYNTENLKAAKKVLQILEIENIDFLLSSFEGVWRRFEYKGKTKSGALVYDDYAHHPTEIKAFISGIKESFPNKKLLTIFEPHLTSRTESLFKEFAESFKESDKTIILPIYEKARESDSGNTSSENLVEEASKHSDVIFLDSFDDAKAWVDGNTNEEYIIATVGAGDITLLGDKLIKDGTK